MKHNLNIIQYETQSNIIQYETQSFQKFCCIGHLLVTLHGARWSSGSMFT